MKLLRDLLKDVETVRIRGSAEVFVSSICINSQNVTLSSIFIAVQGAKNDGNDFIDKAVERGASVIICEKIQKKFHKDVTYVEVADTRVATAIIARNFFDNPSSELKLIGVTGTNGKTTTATLLYFLFQKLGFNSGLVSTVRNMIGNEEFQTNNTTPDSITLNSLMRDMVKAGCKYCFMEVSSHSVIQHRIGGLKFAGAVFTNLTQDHLDYHNTFGEYLKAKQGFIEMLNKDAFVLSNLDDKNAKVLDKNSKAIKKYFSLESQADFYCEVVENDFDGLVLNIDGTQVRTKFVGSFNAYNLLGIYGGAALLGQNKEKILETLATLTPVEGRFDHFRSKRGVIGIIDYAHTPDAVEKVLKTIRDMRKNDSNKIITIIGCGGDRDTTKRPIMAKIASRLSDMVILTSDNPRSEDPSVIIKQMKQGLGKHVVKNISDFIDRREAIKKACSVALSGDIILLAGKGHEKYQEVNGIRYPFDDMRELRKFLV